MQGISVWDYYSCLTNKEAELTMLAWEKNGINHLKEK